MTNEEVRELVDKIERLQHDIAREAYPISLRDDENSLAVFRAFLTIDTAFTTALDGLETLDWLHDERR